MVSLQPRIIDQTLANTSGKALPREFLVVQKRALGIVTGEKSRLHSQCRVSSLRGQSATLPLLD